MLIVVVIAVGFQVSISTWVAVFVEVMRPNHLMIQYQGAWISLSLSCLGACWKKLHIEQTNRATIKTRVDEG